MFISSFSVILSSSDRRDQIYKSAMLPLWLLLLSSLKFDLFSLVPTSESVHDQCIQFSTPEDILRFKHQGISTRIL